MIRPAEIGASLTDLALNEIRDTVSALESDIANGPIVPKVAPEEIQQYLTSRYQLPTRCSSRTRWWPAWRRCCEPGRCK